MTTTADITDFMKSLNSQLTSVNRDTIAALAEAKKNLAGSAMQHCTRSAQTAYRADRDVCADTFDIFQAEWDALLHGDHDDLEVFRIAYEDHIAALDQLEAMNVPFSAVTSADLGVKLAKFFPLVVALSKFNGRFMTLQRDLKDIKAKLEKAARASKSKTAKAMFGAAVTGAGLLLGPVGVGTTIGIAVASTAVGLVIDQVLGNGANFGPFDGASKAATAGIDCYENLDDIALKGVGPLVATFNTTVDASDAGMAIYQKYKLEQKIRKVEADYKAILKDMKKLKTEVATAQRNAKRALDTAVRSANGHRSQTSKRNAVAKACKSAAR